MGEIIWSSLLDEWRGPPKCCAPIESNYALKKKKKMTQPLGPQLQYVIELEP